MSIFDIPNWLTAPFRKPKGSRRVRLADALLLRYMGDCDIYLLQYGNWEQVIAWTKNGHNAILNTFYKMTIRDLDAFVLIAPPEKKP